MVTGGSSGAGVRIDFPISPEVKAAIKRYPELAGHLEFGGFSKSAKQLTRLLDNTHYDHVRELLEHIEAHIPDSGAIGERLIVQTDPFQFHQALAEFQLLAHLQAFCGDRATAASAPKSQTQHDIDVTLDNGSIRIEVFSPVDFMGLQRLETQLVTILKYHAVPRGFSLDVTFASANAYDLWFAYQVGNEQEISAWLRETQSEATNWLAQAHPETELQLKTPDQALVVTVKIDKLWDDPRRRQIASSFASRSTDTRLFFELGTAEDPARSPWGRRLERKLRKKQCGDQDPTALRLLVVDFSQAETGWPGFFCDSATWDRIAETLRRLIAEIEDGAPYDVALPAHLSIAPFFARPIVLACHPYLDPAQVLPDVGIRSSSESEAN